MKSNFLSTSVHQKFSTRFSIARKLIRQSGFFNPRLLVALLCCLGAFLIAARTLPAFFQGDAPAKFSRRTLSFAERVAYQHAIEDVYWRHRIWPKEQPNAKPSLDAVMSQAQLEKKVSDYLRKSQALEDYWQRPITAEQLQTEMERMAMQSKKPEVLRELFAALGNDAFIIAECLARPVLADRLLTNWYSYDQRIHGDLKQRATSELQTHNTVGQMKQLSDTYSEVEFVKSDSRATAGQTHRLTNKQLADGAPAIQPQDSTRKLTLNRGEWIKTVQKLAAALSGRANAQPANTAAVHASEAVQIGKATPLQEDTNRYYALAVLEKSDNRIKLATVAWLKETLESWLARVERQPPVAMRIPQATYTVPKVSAGGSCNENTWAATAAPPEARDSHTAVWTGSEMIIWGGEANDSLLNSGGRYDPATDTWTFTNSAGAPSARSNHTAVWTGTEMIVWGGFTTGFPSRTNTGGKYNPGTNSWIPTSTTNAPDGRTEHSTVWTGSEMIVWGGLE